MKVKTILSMLWEGSLSLLMRAQQPINPFYRLTYITALSQQGVTAHLAEKPRTFSELAEYFSLPAQMEDALRSWLRVGVVLGELKVNADRYELAGLSRALTKAKQDGTLAMLEEIATLHHKFILQTPGRWRTNTAWTLADQDGPLIARSSRIIEPFLREVIEQYIPSTGACRLLEVGCGSGTYIRHALKHNPELTAVGLELQPDVAAAARANLEGWGVASRVVVEACDIRDYATSHRYDIVTLHNNIYYFPINERIALLKRIRDLLTPEGRLLLTTGCAGGSAAMELLNLWAASTQGCGRLPEVEEMLGQMKAAGFAKAEANKPIPTEAYCAFIGYSGG